MEKLTADQAGDVISQINKWIEDYHIPNQNIINKFILRYDILLAYSQIVDFLKDNFKDKESKKTFQDKCRQVMSENYDEQLESLTVNDLVFLVKSRKDIFNYLIKIKPYLADYDYSKIFKIDSEEYNLIAKSGIVKIVKNINDLENNKITFQDVNAEYLLDVDILDRVKKFTKQRIIQYADNKFNQGKEIELKSEIDKLCEDVSKKLVAKLKTARKMLDEKYTTLSLFDENTISHYVDLTTEYSMLKKTILTRMSFRDYIEKSLNLLYEINILKVD